MKQKMGRCIQTSPQLVIVTAVAALALVACASSKTKTAAEDSSAAYEMVAEKIRIIVSNSERAERVSSLAEKVFKENEAFAQSAIKIRLQASELSADYDTSHEAFETLFEALFKERRERSERTIGYTLMMRSVVTASEWAAINKALTEALLKKQPS